MAIPDDNSHTRETQGYLYISLLASVIPLFLWILLNNDKINNDNIFIKKIGKMTNIRELHFRKYVQ